MGSSLNKSFLTFLAALVFIMSFPGCSNTGANDNTSPYIDAENECLVYASEIIPDDSKYFEFIVTTTVLTETYPNSDFIQVSEGKPNLLIRIGATADETTDGTDNCYVLFLYDNEANVIVSYKVVYK